MGNETRDERNCPPRHTRRDGAAQAGCSTLRLVLWASPRAVFVALLAALAGCTSSRQAAPPSSPLTGQSQPILAAPGKAADPIAAPSQSASSAFPVTGDAARPARPMSPVRPAGYTEEQKAVPLPPPPTALPGGVDARESAPPAASSTPLASGVSNGQATAAGPQLTPIDLPTALRLVDVNSPTINLARQRVEEAYLVQRNAELAWLPDLQTGPTYDRHDGRDQNSNGTIFEVSKQSLFVGGGAVLDWNTSEIIFGRLTAERLTAAAQASARAVDSNIQLDVALAYFDLLQAYGEYAIFTDALARAEEMLRNAESAEQAGLSKTTADINRARTEVDIRRQRQIDLQAQAAIVSSRLARLLLLRPSVILRPIEPQIMPVGLVPDLSRIDDLIAIGLSNRPEVQENRALIAAATTRWKQAQLNPLIPHIDFEYRGGTFGGGVNDQMDDFGARSDGTAEAFWQLHNFGAGDILQSRIRRTQVNEASLNLVDVQARVAEDIAAAVRSAEAARRSMEFAQAAVVQALETWRRLREASFGLAGAEHQYDPLQPLIALRDLADARRQYLQTVLDYNRAQFRLYWALGQPPLAALPKLPPQATQTPVVPGPYSPKPEEVPAPRQNPGP